MEHPYLRSLLVAGLFAGTLTSTPAQQAESQQSYDQRIARCNDGTFAAPARAACVRAAGEALDRAAGGAPPGTAMTTPDGRAVVVAPEGSAAGSGGGGADVVPSRDGRATIVPPAGSATPR